MTQIKRVFIEQSGDASEAVEADLTQNELSKMLRAISDKKELDFLYKGFTQFFGNVAQCEQLYLPQSTQVVPFIQEL